MNGPYVFSYFMMRKNVLFCVCFDAFGLGICPFVFAHTTQWRSKFFWSLILLSNYSRSFSKQIYSRVQKSIENFIFRPKLAIFLRAGMREGELKLPLAFQYLIFMLWRACDLTLVMISLLATKWQDFRNRALQFHFIKQLKNGHSKFKVLPFWSQQT